VPLRYYVLGGNAPVRGNPAQLTETQTPLNSLPNIGTDPNTAVINPNLITQIPLTDCPPGSGTARYYWLYLLRPADPTLTAPTNYNVVVDAFRFPYFELGGTINPATMTVTAQGTKLRYATERLQPYRGGHSVPMPGGNTPPAGPVSAALPPYAYGWSEQTQPSTGNNKIQANFIATTGAKANTIQALTVNNAVSHTLGHSNAGGGSPNDTAWDYFPFFDRDFASVAELLLVPGCPPGLFTKQFVEQPPIFWAQGANLPVNPDSNGIAWPYVSPPDAVPTATPSPWFGQPLYTYTTAVPSAGTTLNTLAPHPYPYLVDKFYYQFNPDTTPATATDAPTNGSGWHTLLEYFEVPSSAIGSIGLVANGENGDWQRQDVKPGMINLNLIIDEEVFFGLIDDPRLNLQAAYQPAAAVPLPLPQVVTQKNTLGVPSASYPIGNRGFSVMDYVNFQWTNNGMKAAFADFLRLRHGGTNTLFAYSPADPLNLPPANPPDGFGIHATDPPLYERPFHTISDFSIENTVMRPAMISTGTRDLRFRPRPLTPATVTPPPPGTVFTYYGPAIPPRRLFEIPDFNASSNASEIPRSNVWNATGPGYPQTPNANAFLNNQNSDLLPSLATNAAGGNQDFLGGSYPYTPTGTAPGVGDPPNPPLPLGIYDTDDRRAHPYFRTEMLQKVMNLSTVRTHQYAVWITVGFFEVVNPGNPSMAAVNPLLVPDELGKELGAAEGKNVRYRGFFIVDRTFATGFNPFDPGDFRQCVVFRRRIE
jgi:hypothetical protein